MPPFSCALALALLLLPAAAQATEIEERWSATDEQATLEPPGGRQARASIYRGDHLLAVRCHDDGEERWESLLFGATWFGHPRAQLVFDFSVDGKAPISLSFERETDYRFVGRPSGELLNELMSGSSVTIAGPDFVGKPVEVPLDGSRDALTEAFAFCGYALPEG